MELYLLAFKDRKHFKIGISKNIESRIKSHYNTYELDEDNLYIVKSNKSAFVYSLEQELLILCDCLENNIFYGKDGYTEIRSIDYLNKCIEYIKKKDYLFGFELVKYKYEIKKIQKKINNLHIKNISFKNKNISLEDIGRMIIESAEIMGGNSIYYTSDLTYNACCYKPVSGGFFRSIKYLDFAKILISNKKDGFLFKVIEIIDIEKLNKWHNEINKIIHERNNKTTENA